MHYTEAELNSMSTEDYIAVAHLQSAIPEMLLSPFVLFRSAALDVFGIVRSPENLLTQKTIDALFEPVQGETKGERAGKIYFISRIIENQKAAAFLTHGHIARLQDWSKDQNPYIQSAAVRALAALAEANNQSQPTKSAQRPAGAVLRQDAALVS